MNDTDASLIDFATSPHGRAIIFLVPLAVVAWMEGEPQLEELLEIASHHVGERCREELGCLSGEARGFFYFNFVYGRPAASLVGTALALLAQTLDGLSEPDANHVLQLLQAACNDVAKTGRRRFLRPAIGVRQKRAIREMLRFVRPRKPAAGSELATGLGLGSGTGA